MAPFRTFVAVALLVASGLASPPFGGCPCFRDGANSSDGSTSHFAFPSFQNVVNGDDYELDIHGLLPQFALTTEDEFEISPVTVTTVYIADVVVKVPLYCPLALQFEVTPNIFSPLQPIAPEGPQKINDGMIRSKTSTTTTTPGGNIEYIMGWSFMSNDVFIGINSSTTTTTAADNDYEKRFQTGGSSSSSSHVVPRVVGQHL